MSDHTDDDTPRERYEGPMASAARAETTGCEACGGTGFLNARHSDRFCPTCEGTGTAPNGNSPENPESSGREVNATGHDGCIRGLERANATIAEQAAEIERLRGANNDPLRAELRAERDTLRLEVQRLTADATRWQSDVRQLIDEHKEDEARYGQLRLEVQRLKDLNFEAQDRYAALEAERDELRAELAREKHADQVTLRACNEANARAEKYLAVIKAKDLELFYTVGARSAALKACAAMAEAGLPLHVIEETDHD